MLQKYRRGQISKMLRGQTLPVNGASLSSLLVLFPRCSVSAVQASQIGSFFMLWCYCLEDILHSPLPPVFRSPSNIHVCSILGLKIQPPPPISLLIQPIGLLGNRVAGSMTHPDAGELSSLIINTLGSFELKKGMRGVWIWSDVHPSLSTPLLSLIPIFSLSLFFLLILLSEGTKISFGHLMKECNWQGNCLFRLAFHCSDAVPVWGSVSGNATSSQRGYQ